MAFDPKRILVTGGFGFIGSNFIRQRLADPEFPNDARIVNVDTVTYAGNPANLADLDGDPRLVNSKVDIADAETIHGLLREHAIEAVLHCAAESHVDRSIDSPEPFFQTNVIGTVRLLDAGRRYWRDTLDRDSAAFRFLHVSTDEVFGQLGPEDPAFEERTPYDPSSPYSASKAASDHAVRAYGHTYGLPVLVTNCSNNYGPFHFPEKLIPLMILNALEGKPLPIYGDGGNVRDWLFVEDHTTAIWTVLRRGRPGETYCVGGNAERTNLEVVDTLCHLLDEHCPRGDGSSYAALKTFVRDRPGHDRRYAINAGKIRKELGWRPSVTFEDGIRRTVQWYLDNRAWCDQVTRERYQRQRLGQA
ncbi:MAG: dTDP-glucose 4,6-dehydratase [Opitutales bacterium]